MSRIGKKPIILKDSVKASVDMDHNLITITGPKGTLSQQISSMLSIHWQNQSKPEVLNITPKSNTKLSRQMHGLSRTLVNNMIIGVTEGFCKSLEIQGVGYRSQMNGQQLVLNVGFSHPVMIDPPENIILQVTNNVEIQVLGIDKEIVGQIAAKIRSVRPPEPYKGKGIRYKGEIVKKKVGKAGK